MSHQKIDKELSDEMVERIKNEIGNESTDAHIEADDILCELLSKLGYNEVVAEYLKLDRYFWS
jgi:hypothetical protein